MNYQQLLRQSEKYLREQNIEEPEDNARRLFFHVTGLDQISYVLKMADACRPEEEEALSELLEKRAGHIPLQMLTGRADFYGRIFHVNENVLIPRYDSETLIEAVLPCLRDQMSILDIGTGSGCLIETLLLENKTLMGTACDISEGALATASENAEVFGLSNRLHFIKSDLYSNIDGEYDIIISNPPYIRSDVIPTLDEEVRRYEPVTALDGGRDGLDIYRRLIPDSLQHLKENGLLFLEIGYDQGSSVAGIMEEAGYGSVSVIQDLCGNDRVVWGIGNVRKS